MMNNVHLYSWGFHEIIFTMTIGNWGKDDIQKVQQSSQNLLDKCQLCAHPYETVDHNLFKCKEWEISETFFSTRLDKLNMSYGDNLRIHTNSSELRWLRGSERNSNAHLPVRYRVKLSNPLYPTRSWTCGLKAPKAPKCGLLAESKLYRTNPLIFIYIFFIFYMRISFFKWT